MMAREREGGRRRITRFTSPSTVANVVCPPRSLRSRWVDATPASCSASGGTTCPASWRASHLRRHPPRTLAPNAADRDLVARRAAGIADPIRVQRRQRSEGHGRRREDTSRKPTCSIRLSGVFRSRFALCTTRYSGAITPPRNTRMISPGLRRPRASDCWMFRAVGPNGSEMS